MSLPDIISGRVWKLGDHVNTDLLHPSSYFSLDAGKVEEGIKVAMERLGAMLNSGPLESGVIIVAGLNFGCGSSRETSVRGLRHFGVRGVVAASFARIFMRSLINLGIPALECREIQSLVTNGDRIHLNLNAGRIELEGGKYISLSPLDTHVRKILEAGGLIPYLRRETHAI